jgi:hypothetical protein
MHDIKIFQKHRIKLSDYDHESDVKNRLFFPTLNELELEILEEFSYLAMNFSIQTLIEGIECTIETLREILRKFSNANLINFKDDLVIISKSQKRLIEERVATYEPDFKYNLEYLQTLLRKVPIDIQPLWYQLPRTSDNIFNSIIEKYLVTPTLYQRHLGEIKSLNPIYRNIIDLVFANEMLRVPLCELQSVLSIEDEEFEKHIIFLEFCFILFKTSRITEGKCSQYLEPLHEYKEFLLTQKNYAVKSSIEKKITPYRPSEFSFIEDMTDLAHLAKHHELVFELHEQGNTYNLSEGSYKLCFENLKQMQDCENSREYLKQVLTKLESLDLIKIENKQIVVGQVANEWMELELMNRSHVTFKHPYNQVICQGLYPKLYSERLIHDIENAVAKTEPMTWVNLDEFISQSMISIDKNARLQLKKVGSQYKYLFPEYTQEQKEFIRAIIENFLFESSIVELAYCEEATYFKVTSFGRFVL